MKKHPLSSALAERLARCGDHYQSWTGVAYRSASVKYANRDDLLTGHGAQHYGARWNPPGSTATIYASVEIETAVAEALAHHRYYEMHIANALPRVLVAIHVELHKVINLVDVKIRRMLGTTRRELLAEDWRAVNNRRQESVTQTIGRLAAMMGCDGLMAPSAAHSGGVNLAIFPDNVAGERGRLRIINATQLPQPPG
jgi:RES domain-containing protein